ncbi:MAG: ribosome-associated heat shock protein Hsp15 [Succinivibrio sp.]|uniref:Heat shock protein 15 n=1 Tax=Succinivibrio faecicola TaxID=2820300 RepID=A0ABS7DFS6_9GAMM|nr:ribosome-associated heat shock protein Hsp15 [Succinivibrio faecicola]MBQ2381419.1 ribosome-associated heat shock protein Hsp15 [Succinivibrio sp.]MBW7569957.1 ribosome-associated heat shock protein Hsp15 [Succinivibrio faecicola]
MTDNNSSSKDVRLDKWLWAARFYKTRSLARQMIDGGKVDYNGVKAKPSRTVEIGAIVKVLQGNVRKEVEILKISDVRGPATVAATLYKETEDSVKNREKQLEQIKINALLAPHPEEKPNKKERRALLNIKYGNN